VPARRPGPRAAAVGGALPAGGRRQIGFDARAAQAEDAENTIVSVKRFMGRAGRHRPAGAKLPYRFVDQPGMVALATRDGDKTPVEVSAEILATCASAPRTASTTNSSAPSSRCRPTSTTPSARPPRTPRSWPA
jgi:molecular chaperone DnaK (HSP70)